MSNITPIKPDDYTPTLMLEGAVVHPDMKSQKEAVLITFTEDGEMRLWSTVISPSRLALAGAFLTDEALSQADLSDT